MTTASPGSPRATRTLDLAVIGILSAVSAAAYAGLAQVWTAITAATGPLGGAFLGLFQFGHLIAFGIVRKPGVAFGTSFLTTVGQLMIGDPAGAMVLGWGVVHGIGAEAVFFAMRYRRPTLLSFGLAAGLAAVLGQLLTYKVYGWEGVPSQFIWSLPIIFVSSAIESGGLSYLVVRGLQRAGLVAGEARAASGREGK